MVQEVGLKDYYAILGISEHSTQDQVKAAWKEAARRHHPDRGGDPSIFSELSEAHDCLSDLKRRAAYDIAFRAVSSLRCPCGKAKLPGSDLCTWCALGRAQAHDQREAQARSRARRERLDRVKSWLRGSSKPSEPRSPPPPPPPSRPPPSAPPPKPPSGDQARRPTPRVELPSAEQILDSILADVAVSSGVRDAGIDVRFQLDPRTGRLKLSGKSVDAINGIRENIEIASDMLKAAQRFMDSD